MNKNLCIRRAIKRNRFGAQRDDRMGPNPSAQLRSPIKQRIVVWVPWTTPSPSSHPVEESFRADIRRLERDRLGIVAAKFIPLTHPHRQTQTRMEGLYRPAALFLSTGDEIGFTILRCPWKPGTSGLYVRCTSVLYPTALRLEYAIFQRGFSFLFFFFS